MKDYYYKSMLAQARVKTITVHTRKEAIAIFDELKNTINAAYESQSPQSINFLLALIKAIYYLAPLPKFLTEINTVGTLPVTGFLENVLVKFRLNRVAQGLHFQGWIGALLNQFQKNIANLNLKEVKGLRQIDFSGEEYRWDRKKINQFISESLESSSSANDPGLFGSIIILFRNFLVFIESLLADAECQLDWSRAIKYLSRGCWMLNNIAREETGISINYFLCLKQQSLCSIAIDNGIINYLLQTLSSKYIFESFGKRIIQFLRFLMFNADAEQVKQISVTFFEETLSKFIIRYNKSEIISEVRSLMCILDKKADISHQPRLEKIYSLFESEKQSDEQQIFKQLSVVSLYAQNNNMSQLLLKDHQKFVNFMITSPNQILVKMLVELLGMGFKGGKLGKSVGETIIYKVYKIVSDEEMKDRLNAYRKRILIDLVKVLKQILDNRENYQSMSGMIKKLGLDKRLWAFSDCTNYQFQKEMVSFSDRLGQQTFHENQRSIFYKLQEDFLQKSKTNFSKPTFESCQEIALLDELFNKCQHLSEQLSVHPDLSLTLVNYTRPFGDAGASVLDSLELEEKEQLRKKLNLSVCKFLLKLMKIKQDLVAERARLVELAVSGNELEETHPTIHKILTAFHNTQSQELPKDAENTSSQNSQQQLKIKQLVSEYFQAENPRSQFIVELSEPELELVIGQMQAYESEDNLPKFLRLLLEISQSDFLCLQIFLKFGSNLAGIYNYLLSNPSDSKKQPIIWLDTLLIRLIKLHIDLYFNDQYMEVNYWLEIVSTIDSYFEVFLTKKRIILLDLILEYFDMNKMLDHQHILAMLSRHSRKDLISAETLQNRGETLGYCLGILLYCISPAEVESLSLHHKQNVSRLLKEGSALVNAAKFASLYYLGCSVETFYDFQLEDWAESAVQQLEGQIKRVDTIISHASEAALKLRRISHFADILNAVNQRKDFCVKKSLLLAEQEVLIYCLKYLVYYIDMFQGEQFKRFYLGEIITNIMATIANLYRHNFKFIAVKGGDIIEYFDALLSISTDGIKDAVCEIMRVLLLKKQIRMMNCETFTTCKQYRGSLPAFSQQHIYFCERIEHILYEDGDLQEELDNYFEDTLNNRHNEPRNQAICIPTPSAYLIPDESEQKQIHGDPHFAKKQSIELEEPLFLEFASEPAIPQSNGLIIQQRLSKENDIQQTSEIASLSQIESKSIHEQGLNRQNQYDGSTQIIELLDKVWSEQEMIEVLQKYLEDPQSIDLKLIIDHLIPLSSKKYYSLLVRLFLKTKTDFAQKKVPLSKITLHDTQVKIICCMPIQFCEPSDDLYEILASGVEGATLGLRYKQVGLRGLQIYAKKFMNSLNLDDLSVYTELLAEKKTFEQLKFLKKCKIYDVINEKFSYFTTGNHSLTHICNLIIETCKYPPLCNAYEIVPQFCHHIIFQNLQPSKRIPILNALKHLCRSSDKHKKQIQNSDFLGELLALLPKSEKQEKGSLAQLLMMGAEQNIEISQLYQQLNLEETLLAILHQHIRQSDYHYQLFFNSLKVLQILATLPQSAIRILKGGMMGLCRPIADCAIIAGNHDIVGVTINIMRNLMEEMELSLSRVIADLEKDGLLPYLLFVGGHLPRCHQIESYLGIFCRLITNSTINKKLLEKIDAVFRILNDLARDQLTSQSLLDQWIKVVFLLAQMNRYSILADVLKSNIFFSGANCLRSVQNVAENILSMNNRMMRELNVKTQFRGLLAIHGYADFLVELLRMANLPLDEYLKILNTLSDLFKNRHFTSKLCTHLFAVVMIKLESHWKDEIAISSIALLKNIKKSVEVTTQFGAMMLEFFGKFVTQSCKISSYEYYSISRQVICLLSHFLIFNQEIRFLFRNRLVLDILKNWIRIAKAMDYTEMPQSFKLFYYAVYCEKSLYIDMCDINSKKINEAEVALEKGCRCNLYRINGTYKEAIIKIDKSKVEIIAFKFPDGIIKDKYRIHLRQLLVIERYQSDKDTLFAESVFTKTLNPFQHKVNPQNCLTILCLTEQSYEVREISIELQKRSDLEQIYGHVKLLVSKWAENQIEEESKLWQLVNKKGL